MTKPVIQWDPYSGKYYTMWATEKCLGCGNDIDPEYYEWDLFKTINMCITHETLTRVQ